MSKKRNKKNSQPKKKNNKSKRKQKLNWYERLFGSIVAFFDGQNTKRRQFFSNIRIADFFGKGFDYIKKNRNAVIFSVSMVAIVAIGYYSIVYETPEEKEERIAETVSVDLSASSSYMDVDDDIEEMVSNIDVENEIMTEENALVENTQNIENTESVEEVGDVTGEAESEVSTETELVIEAAEQVDEATVTPVERITSNLITNTAVNTSAIDLEPTYAPVAESILIGVDMFAIIVDGKEVAYFDTEEKAYELLEKLKQNFVSEDAVEERIIYAEDVTVAKVKRDIFDVGETKEVDEVLDYIIRGTNEQKIYTVESGDNAWDIAHSYDLSVGELEAANPQYEDIAKLQIGDKLSLIIPEPIINVVTISTVQRIDPIPYGRDPDVKTDMYYVGETKTKRAGIPGEKDVIVEVYMKNGKILGEKEISATVLKEPVNQIVYKGTKPAPPRIGTGVIDKPTSRGYITSGFGSRSLGWHNGIDIGLPMYTDVYAADGGVVTYAGYKGTYGKVVIINHGANIETRYAHNQVLKVSAGESVHKGQLIALSGNTGRSTGPHLHFEVRVNGTPVNPTKYVRY